MDATSLDARLGDPHQPRETFTAQALRLSSAMASFGIGIFAQPSHAHVQPLLPVTSFLDTGAQDAAQDRTHGGLFRLAPKSNPKSPHARTVIGLEFAVVTTSSIISITTDALGILGAGALAAVAAVHLAPRKMAPNGSGIADPSALQSCPRSSLPVQRFPARMRSSSILKVFFPILWLT